MTVKDILDTLAPIDERVSVPRFRLYNEDHDLLTDSFYDAQDFAGRDVKSFCPASDGVLNIVVKSVGVKKHYTFRYVRTEELYWGLDADSEEEATAQFWQDLADGSIDLLNADCIDEQLVIEEVSDL